MIRLLYRGISKSLAFPDAVMDVLPYTYVVCVCETWLNNSILSSEILPNYGSVVRCDRVGRIGGGVLVAVKTGIQVTRRHDLELENTEIVVIELMKSNSKPVVLYTFYRPPNSYA
jgi:hypothetical protein